MIVFPRYSQLLRLSLTALTASTLTITGWVSLATVDICGSAALASTREFGQDARHGRNGRAGRNGPDGSSQTIRANGDPARIDLAGTGGEDGS